MSALHTVIVPGITDSYAPEKGPQGCLIDRGIAAIIGHLNRLGATTVYSCSGLPEDHEPGQPCCDFYISFSPGSPSWAIDLFTSRGFVEDGDECKTYWLEPKTRVVRVKYGRPYTSESPELAALLRAELGTIERILANRA